MRLSRVMLIGALVVAAPLAARAASVEVTYRVDAKILKNAVSGTNLTFTLYVDSACTAAVHTQAVAIDDVSLIAQLKLFKPKGGVKPPKTAELQHTLTGVAPAGALYLRVSGTGIAPVGGNCQLQASTVTAVPGSTLAMKDANGAVLGPFDPYSQVVFVAGQRPVGVYVDPTTGFMPSLAFQYASSDCTGPALFQVQSGFITYSSSYFGGTLYYAPASGPTLTVQSQSYRPATPADCSSAGAVFTAPDLCCCTDVCYGAPSTDHFAAPLTLDVSSFTSPFHVEVQ